MFKRMIAVLIAVSMLLQQAGYAQIATQPAVSAYMQSLLPADAFRPVQMRALSFDGSGAASLFLDRGSDQEIPQAELEQSVNRLMDFFYIGLALPNSCFWVNLRPDSQDQIIDPLLEKTELGKVLLEADLQLKKDLAALTSPKTPQGKAYWDKLYARAESLFGQENAQIPTHTRPWIVPGEIIIKETPNGAYVYKAGLKVMLEQDYAESVTPAQIQLAQGVMPVSADQRLQQLNDYSTQLIRSTILPMLTRQVNASKKYAQLRQAYYSLVLAQWFKSRRLGGDALLKRIDSKDISGLTSKSAWSKQTYFSDYKKSFENGEYAMEDTVRTSSGVTVRNYFSGGLNFQAPVAAYNFKGKDGGLDRSLVQITLPSSANDGGVFAYNKDQLRDPANAAMIAEQAYAASRSDGKVNVIVTDDQGEERKIVLLDFAPKEGFEHLVKEWSSLTFYPRNIDGVQYTNVYWGSEEAHAEAKFRGAGLKITALRFEPADTSKDIKELGKEWQRSGWRIYGPFDANTDRDSLSPQDRRDYDMLLDKDGGKAVDQQVKELIAKLLKQAGFHETWVASNKLADIGEPAVEPLIEVMLGEHWMAREYAAQALGKIGDTRAVAPMIKMLSSNDEDMRKTVAEELGKIGDTRAVEPLEKILQSDSSWYARREAAIALGKLKAGIPALIKALSDQNVYVRSDAATSLESIGKPAVGPLAVAMQSRDENVRFLAARALGGIKDPRSTKMLIAGLSDPDKDVRLRAVQKLGDNQAVEAVDALIKTLADPEVKIRYATVKALSRIGDTRAVAPLEKVLANEKEWDTVADAAGRALYELSNKDGGIGFTMYKNGELRNAQRVAVAAEIRKEMEKPGSSDLPSIAFISDYHGDASRFAQLLSDALRQIAGFKGTLNPRDSIEVQLNKQGLSLKTLKSPIYLGGDLFDRGTEGIQCFMMVKEMITLAPERIFYISGNHDFWAFGNLLGLHLPWYEGFRFYDDSTPEQFIDALKGAQELIRGKQASNPELFESQEALRWWTARLAEYNADQDAFQAAFYDGKAQDLRAGFVQFYQDNSSKWNEQQIKAMEDFAGHFARIKVPDPYVGLNGVGKTSAIWWQDLHARLVEAYNMRQAAGADELELAMWDRSLIVCEEAVKEVHDRLTRAMNEGQWWYFIFEAINTQAYASVEWWCKDWSSHKGWGEAVIAEINQLIDEGVLEGPKIDQSNYIDSPVLQAYAKFQRANFNLYLKDPYGNLYSHGWFPVQPDGSISMNYQGKDFNGPEIFEALDAITAEVADFSKSLSQLREGLKVVNTWYADETTIIKPENIRQNREQIGVATINKGIGVLNWTTGHNTLDKLDTQFLAQDGAYAHMEADNGMAPKFGGKGGYVLLGPQGICMRGFEDKESAKIVTAPASGVNVHVGMPAQEYLGNVLTHLWVEGKDGGSLTYDRLEHMLGQMQEAGDKAAVQQLAYVVTYVAGGLVNKAILAAAQLNYGQGQKTGELLERMTVRQSRGYDGVASPFRPEEVVVKDAVEPLRQMLREENETIRTLMSEALMRFEYDSKDGGLDDLLNDFYHELFGPMFQKKLEAVPLNEKLTLTRVEKEALLMELRDPGDSLETILTVLGRLDATQIEELKAMAENTVELKERGIPEKLAAALQLRPNFGPTDASRMDGGTARVYPAVDIYNDIVPGFQESFNAAKSLAAELSAVLSRELPDLGKLRKMDFVSPVLKKNIKGVFLHEDGSYEIETVLGDRMALEYNFPKHVMTLKPIKVGLRDSIKDGGVVLDEVNDEMYIGRGNVVEIRSTSEYYDLKNKLLGTIHANGHVNALDLDLPNSELYIGTDNGVEVRSVSEYYDRKGQLIATIPVQGRVQALTLDLPNSRLYVYTDQCDEVWSIYYNENKLISRKDGGKEVGGIDFRAMPADAVSAAMGMPAVDIVVIRALAEHSKMANLDKEWAEIVKLLQAKGIPCEKVKEFVAVCSVRQGAQDKLAMAQEMILETIKMQEACAIETPAQERELLVMLESI